MNLLAARWPQTDTYQATTNPAFGAKIFDRIPTIPFAKSLKADTFTRTQPSSNLKFGFSLDTPSPYSALQVITDFNDQTSNARILTHALKVARFVHKNATQQELDWLEFQPTNTDKDYKNVDFLPFVSDIPFGNVAYAARTLSELWTDAQREVFIHVVDPGVGNGQDRSILVEENGSVFIGPNNGSLSKLAQKLNASGTPFDLFAIDLDKVTKLKQAVHQSPDYQLPSIFHGRDVFAVIAGAVIAGVKPESFKNTERTISLVDDPFATPKTIRNRAHNPVPQVFRAIPDNTYGNIVTNSRPSVNFLKLLDLPIDQRPRLQITNPATGDTLTALVATRFSDAPIDAGVIYQGSTDVDQVKGGHSGALEIAVNGGSAAQQLGFHKPESVRAAMSHIGQNQAIIGSIPLTFTFIPPPASLG